MEPKWDRYDPPSDLELEKKFRWLVEPVLGVERTEKLVEMVWKFENVETTKDLIDLCVK